jgi:hypothetical protein
MSDIRTAFGCSYARDRCSHSKRTMGNPLFRRLAAVMERVDVQYNTGRLLPSNSRKRVLLRRLYRRFIRSIFRSARGLVQRSDSRLDSGHGVRRRYRTRLCNEYIQRQLNRSVMLRLRIAITSSRIREVCLKTEPSLTFRWCGRALWNLCPQVQISTVG